MLQDFYAKLSKPGKLLLVAACICVFCAVMDRVVMAPVLSQLEGLDSDIEEKIRTVQRNLRILSFRESITSEYEQYEPYIDILGKTEDETMANHLQEVEMLAAQTKITIANIEPGEVSETPVLKYYQIHLDCEGELADTLEFISLLEESNYLFRVTQYDFIPKSKKSTLIKSSLEMTRTVMRGESLEGLLTVPAP